MSDTSTQLLDDEAVESIAEKAFDLSYAIDIARELHKEFAWYSSKKDETAQYYISELQKELEQFNKFVEAIFFIKSPEQNLELGFETLSQIMDLNIALRRIPHLYQLDEKTKIFFELSTLEFISKSLESEELTGRLNSFVYQYQYDDEPMFESEDLTDVESLKLYILNSLASRLTNLIGKEQIPGISYQSRHGFNQDNTMASSYLYITTRDRIARAADAKWITEQDLENFYQQKVNALVDRLDAYGSDTALQDYYESTQLLRACVKNRSEEQRADFRDSIRRQSTDLLRATKRKPAYAYKIARGEFRGFLKSLEISGGLVSDKNGGFLETAVHGSSRFQSKLNLSRFGIYGMTYGLINAGMYAISTEGRISPITAITSLSLGTVGLFSKSAKNTRAVKAQISIPQRPNAPQLFDKYRSSSSRTKIIEVKDGEKVVDSHMVHEFPSADQQKEIDSLGKRIRDFERDVITDPSTIVPNLPHDFTEYETVQVSENVALSQL